MVHFRLVPSVQVQFHVAFTLLRVLGFILFRTLFSQIQEKGGICLQNLNRLKELTLVLIAIQFISTVEKIIDFH